jgi:hypothetical protein
MLRETIALESLRQRIEQAEYEAGDLSDYIDRGKPNAGELKKAQETVAKRMSEAKALKTELHELIANSPKEAVEEWANWHRGVLQAILQESPAGATVATRISLARSTLEKWDKVLRGEQEYVGINWYFLKDYKEKAEKEFKSGLFKFW